MQRGRQGYVRRRHGDLHLANIVLIERKPVLFDAIEFDPTIASIDVLYDLAFPIMDFLRYGRNTAANALLNRYLKTASVDNLDALAALPLLMSLRAAIRANVLLARSIEHARRQSRCHAVDTDLFRAGAAVDRSYGANTGGRRRTVRNRQIGSGAAPLAPVVLPQPELSCCARTSCESSNSGSMKRIGCPRRHTSRNDRRRSTSSSCNAPCEFFPRAIPSWSTRYLRRNWSEPRSVMPRRLNIRFVGLFLQTDLATR